MTTTKTINSIKDLGTLTKLPNKSLNSLVSKLCLCIGSEINDAKMENEQTAILNIGIGLLSINLIDMQCKFVPSAELKNAIKKGAADKIDPLEYELEELFIKKLTEICEEVL